MNFFGRVFLIAVNNGIDERFRDSYLQINKSFNLKHGLLIDAGENFLEFCDFRPLAVEFDVESLQINLILFQIFQIILTSTDAEELSLDELSYLKKSIPPVT